VEQLEADLPFRLPAAMLAGEFIEPAFKTAIEAEVILAKGQDLAGEHSAIEPFREGEFDCHHLIVGRALFYDVPLFQEPKAASVALAVGPDVGLYPGAGEAPECLDPLYPTPEEALTN
jgi:hypothetical protein